MLDLRQYIMLFEGGQAGHMAHPFDYTDFTANDLIDLVSSLFNGKVEHLKEKLDGFNIHATMNEHGETVFIRNDSNMNEPKGGMSIKDMQEKWAEKELQKKVFGQAGDIITQIFTKLGTKFFNPDSKHRKVINCECIIAGKTNILPYATDRVAFHGYKIYERGILASGKNKGKEGWVLQEDIEGHVEDIYKAAEGIDAAKPRPDLVIRSAAQGAKFAEEFTKEIAELWKGEGLTMDKTIDDWKNIRYHKIAPDWCRDDNDIYNRICNNDKKINLQALKKRYPDHIAELDTLDKKLGKDIAAQIIEPMDKLFLTIGNEFIDILDGFVNSTTKDSVIATLKKDMEETVKAVKASDNESAKDVLNKSLKRLQALGDKYNVAEGIVIMYKGRRLKLTGSFAAINKALGTRFMLEK